MAFRALLAVVLPNFVLVLACFAVLAVAVGAVRILPDSAVLAVVFAVFVLVLSFSTVLAVATADMIFSKLATSTVDSPLVIACVPAGGTLPARSLPCAVLVLSGFTLFAVRLALIVLVPPMIAVVARTTASLILEVTSNALRTAVSACCWLGLPGVTQLARTIARSVLILALWAGDA